MRVLANHPRFGNRTFNDIKMLNAAQKFDKEWVYVSDYPIQESEKEHKNTDFKPEIIESKLEKQTNKFEGNLDFVTTKFSYNAFIENKDKFTIDQLIEFSKDTRKSVSDKAKELLNKKGY